MGSPRSPPSETSLVGKIGGFRLKSKIAKEIAAMRKQGTVTATSDVGVFVSLGTLSEDQQARMATLPAGVHFAGVELSDDRSDAGKSTVSEFGTAASLLGEARPAADAPGAFHPLRQNTISRSTPRVDSARSKVELRENAPRTSTVGPKGFSNAGVLANITSSRPDPSSTSSRKKESALTSRESWTGRSGRGSTRMESLPEKSESGVGPQTELQPSALPQQDSARSRITDFSTFSPPPSTSSSAYNSQRSARAKTSRGDASHKRRSAPDINEASQTPRSGQEREEFMPAATIQGSQKSFQHTVRGSYRHESAGHGESDAGEGANLYPSELPYSRPPSSARSDRSRFSTFSAPLSRNKDARESKPPIRDILPAASVTVGREQAASQPRGSPDSSTGAGSVRSASRSIGRAAPNTSRTTMSLKEKVAAEIAERKKAQQSIDAGAAAGAWAPSFISPPPKMAEEEEEGFDHD